MGQGYVENGNAQAALGGMNTAQRFMEMQMQQKQQGIQNDRQTMYDNVAMNQARRQDAEYAQQQAHEKQMAEVMRGWLNARFGFGGTNDAMGGPSQHGQQQMAPEQMAMMEANGGQKEPPDPRNITSADVLPAMGHDPNLQPFQQRIKSVINNGDYKTLSSIIPYVQDHQGFIKAQAIAQKVLSGELDGNLLSDPKDRAWFRHLANHSPEALMSAMDELMKNQRVKRDQIDEENRRNQYAMDADDRATKRQIDTEQRGLVNDQTRGQNALKQSLDAERQREALRKTQLAPLARRVTSTPPGDGMGPPDNDENAYETMMAAPSDLQRAMIANRLQSGQEADSRRGLVDELSSSGVPPEMANILARTSSGGRINPSVASGLFNNKSEQAAAQQRLRAAQDAYRKTGAGVFKDKGKAITTPGSLAPPTPDEVAKARKGDERYVAKVRAWNDLVQAQQEVEQFSRGGLFSGVKQSSDVWDSLIDEAMGPTGGNEEINGMIQLGE